MNVLLQPTSTQTKDRSLVCIRMWSHRSLLLLDWSIHATAVLRSRVSVCDCFAPPSLGVGVGSVDVERRWQRWEEVGCWKKGQEAA